MDLSILDILKEHSATLTVVMILLIGVPIRITKSIYDFHDEYILQRRYKRINTFLESCKDDGHLKLFLTVLKDAEIFRMATGIEASHKRAEALMKLYSEGHVARKKLKGLSEYLDVDDNSELIVSISKFDNFAAIYSLVAGISIFVLGFILAGIFFLSADIMSFILGVATMLIVALLSRLILSDYRNVKNVRALNLG